MSSNISPCLWFATEAEEAAKFYIGIFKNSRITKISRYPDVGEEVHGKRPGSAMTVGFVLDGMSFIALNGGHHFKFSEAISFQVECATQEEVDYYWERLSDGGDPKSQQCGWLKDKFGLSWQLVPKGLSELLGHPDRDKANRANEGHAANEEAGHACIRARYRG